MSSTDKQVINANFNQVNVLPAYQEQVSSEQLYVSLADLVQEKVFFHPALDLDSLNETDKMTLTAMTGGAAPAEYFVSCLVDEIKAATSQQHKSVLICLSNSDSYANSALLGGQQCEAKEVNPLMGLRGVTRYASESFNGAFALECQVVKQLRAEGVNVEIVVPFVRSLSDAATIIDRLAEQGLPRGLGGLRLHFSVDLPSSALLIDKLMHYFDGVVVNTDNLAQFTLGVDKANEALEHSYDVQNEAVLALLTQAVKGSKKVGKACLVLVPNLEDAPVLKETLQELPLSAIAVTA